MTAEPSIRIDRHFFTRVEIAANPDFDSEMAKTLLRHTALQSTLKLEEIPKEPAIVCTQTVKLALVEKNAIPYTLDIECVGFFAVENGPLDDKLRDLATRIAHQVLYSAIREIVLTNTGRMAWGPFSIGVGTLTAQPAGAPAAIGVEASKPAKPKRRIVLKAKKVPEV